MAYYYNGVWYFAEPRAGWTAYVANETPRFKAFDGSEWKTSTTVDAAEGVTVFPENPKFACRSTSDQAIAADTATEVILAGIRHDDQNCLDANGKFTAPADGHYYFEATCRMVFGASPSFMQIVLTKNGTDQYIENAGLIPNPQQTDVIRAASLFKLQEGDTVVPEVTFGTVGASTDAFWCGFTGFMIP